MKGAKEVGQKKRVQVLMSTYNGERYLREQLDSILNQTHAEIELLIRDDGSQDGTMSILKEYAELYKNIVYMKGENCGPTKSFFQLIKFADSKADYYAFSDQDDVWEKNKIERAIKCLEKHNIEKPIMYCSALRVVDQDLNFLFIEGAKRRTSDLSFGNAMVENCCTGCTIVINQILQKMIAKKRIPECSMHDWWLYLLASCFGKVFYDPIPSIQYRQHKSNVIGIELGWLGRVKKKIRGFHKGRNVISYQLMEFFRLYHPNGKNGELLRKFLYAKKCLFYRIILIMKHEIYRQSRIDTIICKILILIGNM